MPKQNPFATLMDTFPGYNTLWEQHDSYTQLIITRPDGKFAGRIQKSSVSRAGWQTLCAAPNSGAAQHQTLTEAADWMRSHLPDLSDRPAPTLSLAMPV